MNTVCLYIYVDFFHPCFVVFSIVTDPPPNSYVEVLVPSTSEYDLIWRQAIQRGNQVKMWSLGWALIQYDWYPYKKEKFGDSTQRECHIR